MPCGSDTITRHRFALPRPSQPVTSYSNNDHDVVPVLTSGVEGVPLPIRVGVIGVGINGDREGAYSKDEVRWLRCAPHATCALVAPTAELSAGVVAYR